MKDYSNLKFEFFIGATKRDLSDAREKLIDAILEAKHIPSGMELWAAGCDPLLIDIANHLQQCGVHIIVLGARYGEYIEGDKISFTEWEYKESYGKRPILAFLLNEEEFKKEHKKVISEDPREKAKENDLIRFRNELKASRFCKFFSNTEPGIEKLGRLCVNSVHQLINARGIDENAGWIKVSSLEVSTLRQIRENKFLERELTRMRKFSVLSGRVVVDTVSKERQAQIFWETMKGRVRRHEYRNLFFESGSTLAYVSDQFESLVLKSGNEGESWRIWTNNVLTLFQLLLYTDVDVRRFPPSAPDPEDKYGAIFPREWRSLEEPPFSEPRSLHPSEAGAVDKMRKKLRRFGEKVLFLATTSGWDLDHHLNDFRGPHVGSHPNMLFKRALFTCGHPVVIFLNAEKLGDPFEVGKCYPIFGPEIPLGEALKKFPLAFCVGYTKDITSPTRREGLEPEVRKVRNDPMRIAEMLTNLDFNVIYTAPASGDTGAIIAGNKAFKKLVPND